jgi:zinc transporter ZupT
MDPGGLLESLFVVGLPAVLMLVGSAIAFFERVPEKIQACTQNFSAGLLISAVAGELYPLMNGKETPVGVGKAEPPSNIASTLSICLGFMVGLGFMFGIESLIEDDDDEEDAGSVASDAVVKRSSRSHSDMEAPMLSALEADNILDTVVNKDARTMQDLVKKFNDQLATGNRDVLDSLVHELEGQVDAARRHLANKPPLDQHNISRMEFHVQEMSQQIQTLRSSDDLAAARTALSLVQGSLAHIHEHAHRSQKFKRWQTAPVPEPNAELEEKIDWRLVFTVAVDGCVDGLLIGLAFAASEGAGWAMSIATTIEMTFLGLSFSASIQNATRSKGKHLGLVLIPPILLVVSGMMGRFLGHALEENPLVFICFIAFSVVALLFLVTQELLAEAREAGGDSKLINSMFFIGLLSGVILSKIFD